MKSTRYLTIDVTTVQGLRRAERLVAGGWRIIRSGLFTIQLASK